MSKLRQRQWMERFFELHRPPEEIFELTARLRGTPARLAQAVAALAPRQLRYRARGKWSLHDHVSHLDHLEGLWCAHFDDFEAGAQHLRSVGENTWYRVPIDERPRIADLLNSFSRQRLALVSRLERMRGLILTKEATLPQRNATTTVPGYCFLIAEHDDHHLATIWELLNRSRSDSTWSNDGAPSVHRGRRSVSPPPATW